MRITIVLAILASFLSFGCNTALAQGSGQGEDLVSIVQDPGAINIGESLIHPASPLYFLKTIRERIEAALTTTQEAKVMREVEFALRRLRETNALVKVKKQDLMDSTLEKYKFHLSRAFSLARDSEDLQVKVGEATSQHLDVLQRVYNQVGNPRAKQAVRAALERAEEHNRLLLQKLSLVKQQQLIKAVALRQAFACKFLAREATASGLNDVEREVLHQKVKECREFVRQNLKDELLELKRKREDLRQEVKELKQKERQASPLPQAQ